MTDNNTTLMALGTADTTLALALIFGFMLMAVGFKHKEFWILAGPLWIISGLTIFIDYGIVFLLTSIGLGMALLIMGAYNALE
jgi:hypothetical protein